MMVYLVTNKLATHVYIFYDTKDRARKVDSPIYPK